jgi:RNA polymerase sigma factor (sigma-70 family)
MFRSPRSLSPPPAKEKLAEEIAALYAKEAPGMLRYACPLTGDTDMARDAVQEAFFRFFLSRSAGQSIVSPRAWLFRVVRNYLLDHKRAASRNIGDVEALLNLPAPPHVSGEERVSDLLQELAQIGLSAREIECVRLRMEDLRYDEIAGVLGLQPGTVGALLTRAHEKMRKAAAAGLRQEQSLVRAITGEKRYAS